MRDMTVCIFCGDSYDVGTHCPSCSACDWAEDDCKNQFCEEELID